MIANIDRRNIQRDLEALINNFNFVNKMGKNMKAILKREVSEKL
jgi:hypothetical protein